MEMLKRIEIKGYRSIKSMSLELGKINVLIGGNGAGKSNFISFFKMLHEMTRGRLQQYIGTTGRSQSLLHLGAKVTTGIEAKLRFESDLTRYDYEIGLVRAARDTLTLSEEGYVNGLPMAEGGSRFFGAGQSETNLNSADLREHPIAHVVHELLEGCHVYHFHDSSPASRIRQHCYVNDNRLLASEGGNLPAMLFRYRQKNPVVYRRIVSTLQKIIPEFDDFDLQPSALNPNDILLNWRKKRSEYLFGPHQLSDGSLRAMAITTLFLQPEESLPNLLILDEPELGLHPTALKIVAGLIRAAADQTQVIVATQSETFLNSFEPEEIVTVESHRGESRFRRLESNELKDWLEDYTLGDLWQRNVFGGGPLA